MTFSAKTLLKSAALAIATVSTSSAILTAPAMAQSRTSIAVANYEADDVIGAYAVQFQKDFETMTEQYKKLTIPKNRTIDTYTTKLLYTDDKKFILAYLEKKKYYEIERNYTIAEYNYQGNITNIFTIGVKIKEDNK